MRIRICIVGLLFVLVGCNSNAPKNVAEKFLLNLSVGKIDEAKKYATEPTGKMLDLMVGLGGAKDLNPNFKFTFVRDSIVENQAWVFYKDEKDKTDHIELVKLDGKWKVNVGSKK